MPDSAKTILYVGGSNRAMAIGHEWDDLQNSGFNVVPVSDLKKAKEYLSANNEIYGVVISHSGGGLKNNAGSVEQLLGSLRSGVGAILYVNDDDRKLGEEIAAKVQNAKVITSSQVYRDSGEIIDNHINEYPASKTLMVKTMAASIAATGIKK